MPLPDANCFSMKSKTSSAWNRIRRTTFPTPSKWTAGARWPVRETPTRPMSSMLNVSPKKNTMNGKFQITEANPRPVQRIAYVLR